MSTIADTVQRLEAATERRPGFGSATSRSRTTIDDGLRCSTIEGEWTVETDLPMALGGSSSAPSPSVLMRAAFGACMAMSYRLRAERAGLRPFRVTVEVEADSDLAGMLLATSAAPPGFTAISYCVVVECDAAHDAVCRVLDEGDRLSPMLDTIRRSIDVTRSTTIRPAGG